jgi:hypothetical protein
MARKYFGQFLDPVSKHLTGIRTATRVISRNQGLRLLLNSGLALGPQPNPDVYPFAAYLGKLLGCTQVITIGSPTARDLIKLFPQFEIAGVVPATELESYRRRYRFATWLGADFNGAGGILPEERMLKSAIIVCANVIEHLVDRRIIFRHKRGSQTITPRIGYLMQRNRLYMVRKHGR